MDHPTPFAPLDDRPPDERAIRRALEVLQQVHEDMAPATPTEAAFIAGATAALSWVVGREPTEHPLHA
ncbi:hypothetical protein [Georgenia wangjunii]|uniref:hypothetical protein n=1 Tax=Georgenia wangjunii TaxID=3117730 RepID=UPI002F26880E